MKKKTKTKKKNRNFFNTSLDEHYRLSFKFAKEFRWYFVFSLGIFSLFFIIGLIFPVFFVETIKEFIRGLTNSLEGEGITSLIRFIFLNNVKAAFFAMAFGILLGIVPFLISIANGYLLGFVAGLVAREEGILVLWRLLPHGIFELPAILFSIAIGIKLGVELGGERIKHNAVEGIRFFIFIVIPLLVVAGIIEGILVGFTV